MTPIKALNEYDALNEQQFRDATSRADDQNLKKGSDIIMKGGRSATRNPRIVVYSDDGTAWEMGVSNAGTTTWTAL